MSVPPDQEDLLAAFVRAAREVDPDVGAVEISDALYLAALVARVLPAPTERAAPAEVPPGDALISPPSGTAGPPTTDTREPGDLGAAGAPETRPQEPTAPGASAPVGGTGGLYADVAAEVGERARRVRVPAGRALSDPLGVARALRPLMRRVPSRKHVSLDVEATVEHVASLRLAQIRTWFPVLRPDLERWLTVDLLVDVAPTMAPWQETVDELHHLLEGCGGFRAVRRWGWDTTAPGPPRPFHAESPARSVARLPSADGDRVVLTVTDCLGRSWRDGSAFAYLADIGATSAVALAQVLPRHLWSRTALGGRLDARVRAAAPAAANRLLPVDRIPKAEDDLLALLAALGGPLALDTRGRIADGPPPVPIPVTMLDAGRLAPWARLVAGRAGPPLVAALAVPRPAAAAATAVAEAVEAPTDGMATRRLVEVFRGYASPGARQLAVYLTAAAPLTLSIMRVVRDALIRDPSEAHIAEVLMSGLLREIQGGRPRDPAFDWIPDAQRQLAFALRATDLARVTSAVTDWMNARVGSPRELTALTPDPTGAERLVITERTLPFAQGHANKLRELGEAAAAERLTERLDEHRRAESPRGLEFQRALRGQTAEILRIAWSPDGRWLTTPSVDGTIALWDGASGRVLARLRVSEHGVYQTTWAPDGTRFAAVDYEGRLGAWSVSRDGRRVNALPELQRHWSGVRGASWSPLGDVVAAGGERGLVRLWSTVDWRWTDLHPAPEDGAAVTVAWSPDGALLAVGFWSGTVAYVRRGPDPGVAFLDVHDRRHNRAVTALEWSPRGRLLVTGHHDGALVVRDSQRASRSWALGGHRDTVTALTFSPDGRVLVSKAKDGRVRFWRADTWQQFAELEDPPSNFILSGLAWNPRRPVLATLGDGDRSVRIWHVDIDQLVPTPVVLPTAGAAPLEPQVEPERVLGSRDHALVVAGHAPDPSPVVAGVPRAYRWLLWLAEPDGGGLAQSNVRPLTGPDQPDLLGAPSWDVVNAALAEILAAAVAERAAGRPCRRLYVSFAGRVSGVADSPWLLFARTGRSGFAVSANELLLYLRRRASGAFDELVFLVEGEQFAAAEALPTSHPLLIADEPSMPPVRYFYACHVATAPPGDALTRTVIDAMSGPAADPDSHEVTSDSLRLHLASHPLVKSSLRMEYSTEPIVFRRGVVTAPATVVLQAAEMGNAQISAGGTPVLQVPLTPGGLTTVQLAPGVYHLAVVHPHDSPGLSMDFVVEPGPAVQTVEVTRRPGTVATQVVFTLEAFKAGHGSAFLIRYGPSGAPRLVLVDGGPAPTYRQALRPRLEALRSELFGDAPLPLELVAVTHGDDDSIRGVIDLLSEMAAFHEDHRPAAARIGQFWFNDFGSLLDRAGETGPTFSRQSRQLVELASRLDVPANMGRDLVLADTRYELASGLRITVVGPSRRQVESIARLPLSERPDAPAENPDRATESEDVSPRGADRSTGNLLSLVLLFELRGRTMLLCGDARGDGIVAGLKAAGRMEQDRCHVDLLVVPHHGSPRTVTPGFFRQVLADHYVFTGRGSRFQWPSPEGVEMLLDARGDSPFTIHFNHAPDEFETSYPLRSLLDRFEADRNAGKRYQVRFAAREASAVRIDLDDDARR